MKSRIDELREGFRPDRIRFLLVAESPPESTEAEVRFFYNPAQERGDPMYRSVMAAVFPDFRYEPGEKAKWLSEFKRRGFYMIDASDRPVNHLSARERRQVLEASVETKLAEIARLVDKATPIVLVKRNVFTLFNAPLRRAGFNVVHESFLPFPSHGWQPRFIESFRALVREHADGA